jgi:hypothetical protein
MSEFEHLFFCTGRSPEMAAEQLARLPNMTVRRADDGRVFVTRPGRDGRQHVGGQVSANKYRFPDEVTALDG